MPAPTRLPAVLALLLPPLLTAPPARAIIAPQPGPPLIVSLGVAPDGGDYLYSYTINVANVAPGGVYTSFGSFGVNGLVSGSETVSGDGFTYRSDDNDAPFFATDGTPGEGLAAGSPVLVTLVSTLTPTGTTELFASGGDSFVDPITTRDTVTGPGAATDPGASQANALAPSAMGLGPDGNPVSTFSGIQSGLWTDPLGSDFQFSVLPNSPDFSAITLPTGLGGFTLTTPGGPSLPEMAGSQVFFGPNGVAEFDLIGDSTAGPLPVQTFFVGGGVGGFTQRVLPAAVAVPEPSAFALLGLGLLPVGLLARKRKANLS